ncbi:MAG: polyphosphate kinase 1 [Clostridiales bacterium]|nr:polyphosphate kinase 1 [Clostridiales bacterium]
MIEKKEYRFTQNRELSWLKFNDRVLSEAMDETVPVLERLKFISIFTSNLDEFFMIRVGSLFDMMHVKESCVDNKSGLTPREQLTEIYEAVRPLYKKRDDLFFELENRLRSYGIYRLSFQELELEEQKYIKKYFKTSVLPVLSPQIVDTHHPFPHLQNKVMHIGAMLKQEKGKGKEKGKEKNKGKGKEKRVFAIVPVPASLPEVVFLAGNELRFIAMEDILYEFIGKIYDTYTVVDKVQMCITRNADIHPEDENFEVGDDFRKSMKKALSQRKCLAPVRLELNHAISPQFNQYLREKIGIGEEQIFITQAPIRFGYVFSLSSRLSEAKKKELTYPPFSPQMPGDLNPKESILSQVQKKDILLSYPYESMKPFLDMMKEAANDPDVLSIQITIYRLASKSKLVEYLCMAAENGKDVTVLIELRARFDEKNNIDWSEQLEAAGCTIIYGIPDYKVHSKICLITRRTKNDISFITQVGTGNYNEKTAELYTDLSLLTANQEIGRDAKEFFRNMAIGNLYGEYERLLVAPVSLKKRILQLMDREIEKGEAGRIFLKFNSLTDIDIIEKLHDASAAGVQIRMIIRGICCIVPGILSETDNIEVISVVGRFLEHSRIYCFGEGEQEELYISSADFMTRNTERRVEVACPIISGQVREKIHRYMDTIWRDTLKARVLLSNREYVKKEAGDDPMDCQKALMNQAETDSMPKEQEQSAVIVRKKEANKKGFFQSVKDLFKKK